MRTHITLAAFVAAVSADAADDAMAQAMCDSFLWGLEQMGWTCWPDMTPLDYYCENIDSSLMSEYVDSSSSAWEMSCTLSDGTRIAP